MHIRGRDLTRRPVLLASTLGLVAIASLTAILAWPTATDAGAPARLSVLENDVDVVARRTGESSPARNGQRVGVGDTVRTDATGEAEITYEDGSITHLGSATTFTLLELADEPARTLGRLDVGRAWHRVRSFVTGSGGLFEVLTDAGVAAVRGTTFVTACDTETCRFLVVEGTIELRSRDGGFLDLVEGEAAVVDRRTGSVERVEMVGLADPDLAFATGDAPPTLALEVPATTPPTDRAPAEASILERTVPPTEARDATTTVPAGGEPDEPGASEPELPPREPQAGVDVPEEESEADDEAHGDQRGRRLGRGHDDDRGHDHGDPDDGGRGHDHG